MDFNTPGAAVNNEEGIKFSPLTQNLVYKMQKDMKFVGIWGIISGILACITIIGALVGIPTLIAGLRLKDAADSFKLFLTTNNPIFFEKGLEQQGSYFQITKIMIIITIVFMAIMIVFYAFIIAMVIGKFSGAGLHTT
jgi:hypothetical protein